MSKVNACNVCLTVWESPDIGGDECPLCRYEDLRAQLDDAIAEVKRLQNMKPREGEFAPHPTQGSDAIGSSNCTHQKDAAASLGKQETIFTDSVNGSSGLPKPWFKE